MADCLDSDDNKLEWLDGTITHGIGPVSHKQKQDGSDTDDDDDDDDDDDGNHTSLDSFFDGYEETTNDHRFWFNWMTSTNPKLRSIPSNSCRPKRNYFGSLFANNSYECVGISKHEEGKEKCTHTDNMKIAVIADVEVDAYADTSCDERSTYKNKVGCAKFDSSNGYTDQASELNTSDSSTLTSSLTQSITTAPNEINFVRRSTRKVKPINKVYNAHGVKLDDEFVVVKKDGSFLPKMKFFDIYCHPASYDTILHNPTDEDGQGHEAKITGKIFAGYTCDECNAEYSCPELKRVQEKMN